MIYEKITLCHGCAVLTGRHTLHVHTIHPVMLWISIFTFPDPFRFLWNCTSAYVGHTVESFQQKKCRDRIELWDLDSGKALGPRSSRTFPGFFRFWTFPGFWGFLCGGDEYDVVVNLVDRHIGNDVCGMRPRVNEGSTNETVWVWCRALPTRSYWWWPLNIIVWVTSITI